MVHSTSSIYNLIHQHHTCNIQSSKTIVVKIEHVPFKWQEEWGDK